MKDEKRRRVMMWIAAVVAVLLLIGVVSWIWERSYYGDQPFTFSQLILLLLIIPVGVLLFAMFVNPDKKQRGTSGGGPSNPVVASFPDAFTTVVVPWQGRPVTVVRVPTVPLDQMKGTNNDFEPKELVINVEVVDANKEHTIMTDFDPTLEIEFNFPKTLIDNARKLSGSNRYSDQLCERFHLCHQNRILGRCALGAVHPGKSCLQNPRKRIHGLCRQSEFDEVGRSPHRLESAKVGKNILMPGTTSPALE